MFLVVVLLCGDSAGECPCINVDRSIGSEGEYGRLVPKDVGRTAGSGGW